MDQPNSRQPDNMHLETRVLVTGRAGFLGSHLCERLLQGGADLICLDNYFTGSRRYIDHLLEHKNFEFVRHDVTFPLYVEVDQIYNASSGKQVGDFGPILSCCLLLLMSLWACV